jgi:hypothetical protein
MSTALRYASICGFLAVRKNTVGDVCITTNPPTVLTDSKPKTLATGLIEVDQLVRNSNVKKLLDDNIISLVF